eukprot:1855252-Prymnesium_polylepis.1
MSTADATALFKQWMHKAKPIVYDEGLSCNVSKMATSRPLYQNFMYDNAEWWRVHKGVKTDPTKGPTQYGQKGARYQEFRDKILPEGLRGYLSDLLNVPLDEAPSTGFKAKGGGNVQLKNGTQASQGIMYWRVNPVPPANLAQASPEAHTQSAGPPGPPADTTNSTNSPVRPPAESPSDAMHAAGYLLLMSDTVTGSTHSEATGPEQPELAEKPSEALEEPEAPEAPEELEPPKSRKRKRADVTKEYELRTRRVSGVVF